MVVLFSGAAPVDPNVEPEDEYDDSHYWKGQSRKCATTLELEDVDELIAFGLHQHQAGQVRNCGFDTKITIVKKKP